MGSAGDSQVVISVHRPDQREKMFFMLAGVLISVPFSFFFETMAANLLGDALPESLIGVLLIVSIAPIVEEFAKVYPLFYRHGETQRSIFTLGLFVGLGFGAAEFFTYVFALGVPILLRLPGLIFHATNTSITAYGIAVKNPAKFFIIAVLLHFANNLSAVIGFTWFIIGIPAMSISILFSHRLYRKTSEKMIE